ncbi:MAG: hypothetical protein V4471_00185 [Pseudomonadota bacterium]
MLKFISIVIVIKVKVMAKSLKSKVKDICSLQNKFKAILLDFRAKLSFFIVSESIDISLLTNQIEELFNKHIATWPHSLQTFIELLFVIDEFEYQVRDFKNFILKEKQKCLTVSSEIEILENLPNPFVFKPIIKKLLNEQPLMKGLDAANYRLDTETFINASLSKYDFLHVEEPTLEKSQNSEMAAFEGYIGSLAEEYIEEDYLTKNKLSLFKYSLYTLNYMQLYEKLKCLYPEKGGANIQLLINNIFSIAYYPFSDFFTDFNNAYWCQHPEKSNTPITDNLELIHIPYIKEALNTTKKLRYPIDNKIESIYHIAKGLPDEPAYATYLLAKQLKSLSNIYFSKITHTLLKLDNLNYRQERSKTAKAFLKEVSKSIEDFKVSYENYLKEHINKELITKEQNRSNLLMGILNSLLNCIKKIFCIPTSKSHFFIPIDPAPFRKIIEEGTALLTIINESRFMPQLKNGK